jgi:hypothetical protein
MNDDDELVGDEEYIQILYELLDDSAEIEDWDMYDTLIFELDKVTD